ncbi:serine hydrolase domain-containing protein [Rugosimonospora acidiphila]|uniref:Serine hydrolase domain-containing protein n=1 Tax=Rugosimonospora acidiphila TaxID=556531 RepID=A0ABP9S5I9_9ACTN
MLPETARRVDEIVASAQANGRVPSLIAGVVRDGTLTHVSGAGELPRPEPDTQYRIGSISKTLTATLVLQLRDEGRLDLDDPLHRHLPGTPLGDVRLRDLLAHVGGVQREPDGQWWERSAGMDTDDLLAGLNAGKVAYPPHDRYHYSNLVYGVLGALIERVAGQPWHAQLAKRLLEPLELGRTTYHATEPFARGYVVHPWHGTLREEPRHDAGAMAPAGQLWSTVRDLARWAAFLADPVPSVLDPATLAQMCTPVVISDVDAWTSGHGLGVQLWRRGERVYVGHTGSMPGYLAVLAVHRPSRTGVVAFANAYTLRHGGISGLGLDLLDAVLDREPARIAPWRPGAAPPPEVEVLTGRWWWMGTEYESAWDAAGRALVISSLDRPGATPWRFTQDGVDRWRCRSGSNDGEIMMVRRSGTGAVTALDIATFVFTRDPWSAP